MDEMSSGLAPTGTRRNQRIATLVLAFVCLVWGSTFLLMKIGTGRLTPLFGPGNDVAVTAYFLFVRFGLAAVLMPVLIPASIRRLDRQAWFQGLWLSLVMTTGFVLQVFGLTQPDLPPSQSAFLTSLYVVAAPIIAAIALRQKPTLGVLIGLPLALLGAGFIAGPPTGGLSLGAWASVACAVVFGGHIVLTDVATRRADPLAITFTMLLFSALWSLLLLLAAPGGLATLTPDMTARVFTDMPFLLTAGVCAVLATVVALSALNRWQKELSPSRAGIIYTGEPVCAAVFSVAAGIERVNGWLFFGAAMILVANLCTEFVGGRRVSSRSRRAVHPRTP